MNRHLHTEGHSHIALAFHICVRVGARIYKEGRYRVPGCCWVCKVDEVSAMKTSYHVVINTSYFYQLQ